MRFNEIYSRWRTSCLTVEQAAEILGVHERTFRRHCRRFEKEGAQGLYDRRLNRVAHNCAPVDEVMALLELFETRYPKFTVAHFYDKWRDNHHGNRSYTWVKTRLQDAGFVKKAKKRGAHRRKRPRRPFVGMMIHQDASTHEWVPGVKWDLVITMDDATSEIYSAFFVHEEGTWSSFRGVKETIEKYGLFCSFYSDRGSHYWTTPKVGGKVDKVNLTQFGRAMQKLGIEMIAAYSPEARGRSERMFRTLQSRLPKELALENITSMEEANVFLEKVFIPQFNLKFTVQPEQSDSAFVPWIKSNHSLNDILCIQSKRTVNKDNTVKYENKTLQIPKDNNRCHYVRATVQVHEYHDGTIALFHGPKQLARYDASGHLLVEKTKIPSVAPNETMTAKAG